MTERTVTAVLEASGEDSGLPGKVTVRPGLLAAAGLRNSARTAALRPVIP